MFHRTPFIKRHLAHKIYPINIFYPKVSKGYSNKSNNFQYNPAIAIEAVKAHLRISQNLYGIPTLSEYMHEVY